jgi:ATP-binding cassette subfamily C protein CydC
MMTPRVETMLASECRRQRWRLFAAGLSAAIVTAASVLLLGLSGQFIAAAGAAGLLAFNTMLPRARFPLLAILRTGCRYTERLCGHDAALRALAHLRPALFRALAAAPPARAMAISAGDATARFVQDVSELEVSLVQRSSLWGAAAAASAGFLLLLTAGVAIAATLLAALAATALVAWALACRMERHSRAIPPANGHLKREFAALMSAAPELRAYGLEQWAAEIIEHRSLDLLGVQQRATAAAGGFDLLLAPAAGVAAMLAFIAARDAPLPQTAMAVLASVMSIDGLAGFLRALPARGRVRAAKARLEAMIGPPQLLALPAQPAGSAPTITLEKFSQSLSPGTIAGLLGPSGCGKTTLLERLVGLRGETRGRISLNGFDLVDLEPAMIRPCFAIAPQDAALLAGTIRENFFLADPAASETSMWEALHDAVLDLKVAALPQGLDTAIGDNGARLSGGERRRLVLARAYLRRAPWLLLDEPTEGLDAGTEAAVVERLQARLAARRQGAIIVSHRAAPLAICNVMLDMYPGSRSTPLVASPPAHAC